MGLGPKRPRVYAAQAARWLDRVGSGGGARPGGAPPAGVRGPPSSGEAARTAPVGVPPGGAGPKGKGGGRPVGARPPRVRAPPLGGLAAGPSWRAPVWEASTRDPTADDLVELAAADLPDNGLTGAPEHRLWRASPYGSVLRPRGVVAFPRPARRLTWGPVVNRERATAAQAAIWRRPDDPG